MSVPSSGAEELVRLRAGVQVDGRLGDPTSESSPYLQLADAGLVRGSESEAQTTLMINSNTRAAVIVAELAFGDAWGSCRIERQNLPEDSNARDGARLSLECEPLVEWTIDKDEPGSVRLTLQGQNGEPIAGEEVQLSLRQRPRRARTVRSRQQRESRPLRLTNREFIGVLGALDEADSLQMTQTELEPAAVIMLTTDETGRAELALRPGEYTGTFQLGSIFASAGDLWAACLWN